VKGWGSVLVSHLMQLIRPQLVLIVTDMVVRGAVGSLDPGVAVQEEVILEGVAHATVDQNTCGAKQAVCNRHTGLTGRFSSG
jgi:hypothetical protein